jgi:hypothetical protein
MPNLIPVSEYESLTSLLTSDERVIVMEMLTTRRSTTELIPDDMDPTDLWRYLSAACKGINRTTEAAARLKLFLGRILVQVQKCPDLFLSQGYTSFNDFITTGVPKLFGISRPEGFIAKKIAEELGGRLAIEEMEQIGISKLNAAANAIRQKAPEGTPQEIRERTVDLWVERAKNSSLDQMKQFAVDDGLAEKGEMDVVTVIFELKGNVYERFKEFRDQPWVLAHVGGTTDSEVLDGMMAECQSWQAEEENK